MNGRSDILSRRIDVMEGWHKQKRPLLRLVAIQTNDPVWTKNCILEYLKVALKKDTTLKSILDFLGNSKQGPLDIRRCFQEYSFHDGILRFQELIYVPDDEELRIQILRFRHDAPATGHQG